MLMQIRHYQSCLVVVGAVLAAVVRLHSACSSVQSSSKCHFRQGHEGSHLAHTCSSSSSPT